MAAALLVSTVTVFAADNNSEKLNAVKKAFGPEQSSCTVTLEGTVSLPGLSVKISCSATSTTCREAINMANTCLNDAKRAIMY